MCLSSTRTSEVKEEEEVEVVTSSFFSNFKNLFLRVLYIKELTKTTEWLLETSQCSSGSGHSTTRVSLFSLQISCTQKEFFFTSFE